MKTEDQKNKFIELRAQGLSYDKIAKQMKISKPTLIAWSREFRIEIANLKAIELEILYEKYYMLKHKRIELFGKRLMALEQELDKRDLKDIPTRRLFDLIITYAGLLKEEGEEIIFSEKMTLPDIVLDDTIKRWAG